MSALAIECRTAATEIWEVPVPAWLPSADTADATPPLTREPASTQTMVALLGEPTLGPAMHSFRDRVVGVERHSMFDRPGWLIEIAVAYDHTHGQGEMPLVLNLLLAQAAWRGTTEPAAGDYLQGVLWLQGRMHGPGGLPGGRMPQRRKPSGP